ncbi:MAG: hypothetical protein R3305_11320, partial [Gammaproteobacteria bacterium]|nr:hypothetical protein [Gammaproteobacteria bacterium]
MHDAIVVDRFAAAGDELVGMNDDRDETVVAIEPELENRPAGQHCYAQTHRVVEIETGDAFERLLVEEQDDEIMQPALGIRAEYAETRYIVEDGPPQTLIDSSL